jgi:hypothetical protein
MGSATESFPVDWVDQTGEQLTLPALTLLEVIPAPLGDPIVMAPVSTTRGADVRWRLQGNRNDMIARDIS